ncbi:MAG: cytochrome c [Bacteroidetes bacterium]|nr:cytochrome c [Bacteroidota bacterium]
MNNCDDLSSCSPRSILGLHKTYRSTLLVLTAVFLFSGCNAFVHDGTPPEWTDPAGTQQDVATIAAGSGGPGAAVFNGKCAVCHQMTGKGIPNVYPPLAGSAIATGDPVLPIRIVLHGFNGPIERGGNKFNGVMQPWQNDLTDQQIADVLTFVRSSWGNAAEAVTADQVKEQRTATKGKIGAYTEEELKSSL